MKIDNLFIFSFSMKKILLRAFLFSPILLFLFYLEYNLKSMPNSYTYKRNCFENQLDSIEVLVLGSSQIAYGVNPIYFSKKGFNIANISQTIFYDTHLVLKYINKMSKLKKVIITISYFSFGEQLYDGVEVWRDYCYSQFWDINFPEINNLDLAKYSKIFLYTPKLSLLYCMQNFKVDLIEGAKPNGYLWHDTILNSLNISDYLGYQRVRYHDIIYKENRVNENIADLELLVRELKRRNIIPIIITPPVFVTYSKYANKTVLNRNQKIILSICEKYDCKYFNYFTDNRFLKSDFYDNDHLNFIGANKFSKILDKEVIADSIN